MTHARGPVLPGTPRPGTPLPGAPRRGEPTRFARKTLIALTLAVLLSAMTLAACSSGEGAPATSGSPTPSVSPAPEPEPPTSLLSGRRGKDGQVLAVKLDNTVNSHPHAGLMSADVVYVEEVEYGLTRLMAVFSSKYPKVVGPVRSARESDLEILEQYGKVAFAFSGANPQILPAIAAAPLYPLSNDAGANGYSRSPDRTAPWDLFADPDELLRGARKATDARDVGFTFDDETPAGGKRVGEFTAFWPSARATFGWSKEDARWLLTMDGSPALTTEGPQLGGTTVIIQRVDVYPSELVDSNGAATPTTETVGKGDAWVFRNGQVWPVTWSRPSADEGTSWKYEGKEFPLDPGQVWVLLLDEDRRPEIR
ncbi:MAG: DUF3048 domain-containing protein [Actinomycetia bacterium]|nr:DUF3048 domain-containing protein [Actinomycetes bacterium]